MKKTNANELKAALHDAVALKKNIDIREFIDGEYFNKRPLASLLEANAFERGEIFEDTTSYFPRYIIKIMENKWFFEVMTI